MLFHFAGVQWSSGVCISTSSPGGEQVWPRGPNTGWCAAPRITAWLQGLFIIHLTTDHSCFPRCPPTWRWSSPTPTTCCYSRRRQRTREKARTSTRSLCPWPAVWRLRSPCSTETWRERTGECDSHKRLRQRVIVLVEEKEEREA